MELGELSDDFCLECGRGNGTHSNECKSSEAFSYRLMLDLALIVKRHLMASFYSMIPDFTEISLEFGGVQAVVRVDFKHAAQPLNEADQPPGRLDT